LIIFDVQKDQLLLIDIGRKKKI